MNAGFAWTISIAVMVLSGFAHSVVAMELANSLLEQAGREASVDVIVQFDSTIAESSAIGRRIQRRMDFDDATATALRIRDYTSLKDRALSRVGIAESDRITRLAALPLEHVRIRGRAGLLALSNDPEVVAIYQNRLNRPVLDTVSGSLIGQPSTQGLGLVGSGVTVAVIDTGVDYTHADFGSCTAPGVPTGCKVSYLANLADASTALDTASSRHGSNVAGIVVGVAPGARIAALNVFGVSGGAFDSTILSAINWAIANQSVYNIRAINMSLGDGVAYSSPCSAGNPYVSAVSGARNVGILTVASAGNDGYTAAIGSPACTPNAVSVGAVYTQNWGGVGFSSCSDSSTAADKVTCFSNSATFLTMLAPGALITAAGAQLAGTSQAAPFVSGAIAVARSAYPGDSLTQTLARLTGQAVMVTDARNGLTHPRLQLYSAIRPPNDDFTSRTLLSGLAGASNGSTQYATFESGEPAHAASGGRSIWYRWVAPSTGQVSLNTHGSVFDTLLAVYHGSALNGLVSLASNNNDGSANGGSGLLFQAHGGAEYQFAVDGVSGVSGSTVVNWSLNGTANADLSVSVTATPNTAVVGVPVSISVSVVNVGPQTATQAQLNVTLPANFSLGTITNGCSAAGQMLHCSIALLAQGGVITRNFVVTSSVPGAATILATAQSELPDNVSGNNSSSYSIVIVAGNQNAQGDVPLPVWMPWALGAILTGIASRARRQRQAP